MGKKRVIPQPVVPGNIDLTKLPIINNPDGSYSTIRSISIGTPQGEVLIPTAVNGRIVSPAAAIQQFNQTGRHLGVFKNAADADVYSVDLHNREDARIQQQIGDAADIARLPRNSWPQ